MNSPAGEDVAAQSGDTASAITNVFDRGVTGLENRLSIPDGDATAFKVDQHQFPVCLTTLFE